MTRLPDGLLTHELFAERGPQDACGVFGVWAPGEEVAKLTFYGLYALQHRGTESAGIAATAGEPSTMALKEIDPFLKAEIAKWAEVVKRAGIKVE